VVTRVSRIHSGLGWLVATIYRAQTNTHNPAAETRLMKEFAASFSILFT